ncbi:unnamed protein product [Arabidopsis lyrata]|nr:unnamed protein product [Arabidopsis lyrata]
MAESPTAEKNQPYSSGFLQFFFSCNFEIDFSWEELPRFWRMLESM